MLINIAISALFVLEAWFCFRALTALKARYQSTGIVHWRNFSYMGRQARIIAVMLMVSLIFLIVVGLGGAAFSVFLAFGSGG